MASSPVGLPDDAVFTAPQPSGKGLGDDDVFSTQPVQSSYVPPVTGEAWDNYIGDSGLGKVLDAFGQGAKDNWGGTAPSPEMEKVLKATGFDYKLSDGVTKAINEGVVRPAASVLLRSVLGAGNLVQSGFSSVIGGAEAAAAEAGKQVGQPELGQTVAGMIEYETSRGDILAHANIPTPQAYAHAGTLLDINKARDLGVIGPDGEAGYFGTTPQEEARKAFAPSQDIPPEEQAPQVSEPAQTISDTVEPEEAPKPTVDDVARQIDPDTFKQYDALATEKATYMRWLGDLKETQIEQAKASAPHADEIADLQQRIADGTTPRLEKKYQARLADLTPEHDAFIEEATGKDSLDMQRVRQALMEADYKMRNLAVPVSDAYRQAREQIGPEPEPFVEPPPAQEPPAGEQVAAAPQEQAPPQEAPTAQALSPEPPVPVNAEGEAEPVDIAAHVSDQLQKAGRPQEEADAAGQLIAAHYEARSANLKGTTPEQLYTEEAPQIVAGRGAAREVEMAQQKDVRELNQSIKFANDDDIRTAYNKMREPIEGALKRLDSSPIADTLPGIRAKWQRLLDYLDNHSPEDWNRQEYEKLVADISATVANMERNVKNFGGNVETFSQPRRGSITLRNGQATIKLFKHADASTFIHETGHQWLEELNRDALDPRATDQVRTDAQTVRNWLGVKEGEAIPRRAHEKFARGFERYMMEGRAPSRALAHVFAKFKNWLTQIYQTVTRLRSPISDDIRKVFDRMIATPGEAPIIGREAEERPSLADVHENIEERTPPEQAEPVADRIVEETARADEGRIPEIKNELDRETGTEASPNAGAGPASGGHGAAAGTDTGEAPGDQRLGEVAPGGGAALPESPRPLESPKPLKGASPFEKIPREPMRLVDYLKKNGGLKDDTFAKRVNNERGREAAKRNPSELRGMAMDAENGSPESARRVKGLIRAKNGMSFDEAAIKAWEEGYFPEHNDPRDIYPSEFYDAIREDLNGNPQYSKHDEAQVAAYHAALERNAEIDRLANHYGIDGSLPKDAFFAKLREHLSVEERAREIASQEEALEAEVAEAEERQASRLGDAFEPGAEGDTVQSRSIEDIENERRQEEDSRSATAGAGDDERPGPGSPAGGQSGARPRGSDSRPVGPHDAYGPEPSRLVDKAGNIRLDNLNTSDDVNEALREMAEQDKDFIVSRRGVVSDKEVDAFADAMGVDAKDVNLQKLRDLSVNDGIPLAARIIAGRRMMVEAVNDMRNAMVENPADAQIADYLAKKARALMVARTVSAVTAEMGRGLRAFRMLQDAKGADQFLELMQSMGKDAKSVREEMALGKKLKTPAQAAKFAQDSENPSFKDKVIAYFINNLISGPMTHMAYSVGNTAFRLFKSAAETPAASLGGHSYAGEAGAELWAALRGFRDGLSPGWQAAKTGQAYMKGLEEMERRANGADLLAAQPNDMIGRRQTIPGKLGYVLETPSRAVSGIHTVFYSMNYEAEIAKRAYRQATKEGLTGDAWNTRVAELTKNPTDEMVLESHNEAMAGVLMKRPAFGTPLYHLQQAVNKDPTGISKIIMPFMQIGTNILREGFVERSVIGFASQGVRDNLMGRNGLVARDAQLAKIGVGTGLAVTVIGLTAEGIMTGGGPSNPAERRTWELSGRKPYSIKIGNYWVPYRKYLGPIGTLIAGAADVHDVGHALANGDIGDVAKSIIFGLSEVVGNESWFDGLSNFIDAARSYDEPSKAGKYLRNLAMDFLPFSIGLSQVTRTIDPYARRVNSWLDAVKAHIPGLSETLEPYRDIWGNPLPGGTMLSPGHAVEDPVNDALERLGVHPSSMESAVRGVRLDPQQYDDLSRIGGRMARMRVQQLVEQPSFRSLPEAVQRELVTKAIDSSREGARATLMMQNPAIVHQAMRNKVQQRMGVTVP